MMLGEEQLRAAVKRASARGRYRCARFDEKRDRKAEPSDETEAQAAHAVVLYSICRHHPSMILRPPRPPKTEISEWTVPGFSGGLSFHKRNLRLGSVKEKKEPPLLQKKMSLASLVGCITRELVSSCSRTSAKAPAESETHGSLCVVCLDLPARVACVPCGHRCMCHTDAPRVSKCPMCRAHIEQRVTVID